MSRKLTFADSFWGTDFQSTAGYEALKKRLKEGKQTCVALEQFLRARAKAEEDYGRCLLKACKTFHDAQESDTLRFAWDFLREQSERIAQIHLEAGGQLIDAASRLNDFAKRQKTERSSQETALCQIAAEKVSLYRKMLESKRNYELKCGEAETAESDFQIAKEKESTYTTKEWDKIVQKQSKSLVEAKKADSRYSESIARLEQMRLQWEAAMSQFCKLCEALEDARIKMVQNEMWILCNVVSSNSVDEDECSESVRNILERVSIDADIQSFIDKASTGRERPAAIKYEEYHPQRITNFTLTPHTETGSRLSNHSNIPTGDHGRPQLPPPPSQGPPLFLPNRNYNR